MTDKPQIRCPIFLGKEIKIKKITDKINKAKTFGEKAEKSRELVEEVEKLLSCEKYDKKNLDCVNCHIISKVRKDTGKSIIEPKETLEGVAKKLGKPEVAVGGIFKGLGSFINLVSEMMEKGMTEVERKGEIKGLDKLKGVHGVYGFTIRTIPSGRSGRRQPLKIERFGNIHEDEKGPKIEESREPIVDVFDEKGHVNVIVEIPGVSEEDIKTEVKDDVLIISAESKDRKYSKEILLPKGAYPKAMKSSYRNGILELKFKKDAKKRR